MIRIAILDHNTHLVNNIAPNLKRTILAVKSELGTDHLINMPTLPPPHKNKQPIAAAISRTKHEMLNNNGQVARWQLNSLQPESVTSGGRPLQPSCAGCCALGRANSNETPVDRKMPIETLGHPLRHYDERCFESLISRLRRKLPSIPPKAGVNRRDYLFRLKLPGLEEA